MELFDNLQRDIELAFELLYTRQSVDDFKLYPWSNEGIHKYYKYYDLKDKDVLCITGSGDHALFAANNGAKEIDCLDKNPLCKYYLALKIALILAYDEKNFFRHFSSKKNKILITEINLDEIKPYLDENVYIFWKEIISSKIFKKNKRMFRDDGSPTKFKMDYQKLKENLSKVKINYYDGDLKNYLITTSKKYDVIFLSNVLEWECCSKEEILSNSQKVLNDNGVVYDTYIKRNFKDDNLYSNLEAMIATEFSIPSINFTEKGVYVYRKH